MEQQLNCAEARAIDLIFYLKELGYSPHKIRGSEYWYLSPLRDEKTPSFKVDRNKNFWYDHGTGKGGTIIDFGTQFHHCSISELLQILSTKREVLFSFHPPKIHPKEQEQTESNVQILHVESLADERLLRYVLSRKIALDSAQNYLKQVHFRLHEKEFVAVGFFNDSGGYELRNEYFKGCAAPKDFSLIESTSPASSIAVFEGAFSFLSYLTLLPKLKQEKDKEGAENLPSNFLILNSLSFLEKSRGVMEKHDCIHLYLDRDAAGVKATEKALNWAEKYKDKSSLYKEHKDLNDYLIYLKNRKLSLLPKQRMAKGRHL